MGGCGPCTQLLAAPGHGWPALSALVFPCLANAFQSQVTHIITFGPRKILLKQHLHHLTGEKTAIRSLRSTDREGRHQHKIHLLRAEPGPGSSQHGTGGRAGGPEGQNWGLHAAQQGLALPLSMQGEQSQQFTRGSSPGQGGLNGQEGKPKSCWCVASLSPLWPRR